MKKPMRDILFGTVALATTMVAGVGTAGADVTFFPYTRFKEMGAHFNGTNPVFVQTVIDYELPGKPEAGFTGLSRCGYERINGQAAYRQSSHIAEWTFFSTQANYLLIANQIDGRRSLVVKDNNGQEYTLLGIRKDGQYVQKRCAVLDAQTGMLSQCVTQDKPSVPRDYFDAYTKTPQEACEKYVPLWNEQRNRERAMYGQETDITAMPPAGSVKELGDYKKQAANNFAVLDAN